ncbi:hypothetical protein QJS66_10150 [Kocuria rhizophila]|nr:hypothetical protein QJS66_10150 [Kocuria rhizophila]
MGTPASGRRGQPPSTCRRRPGLGHHRVPQGRLGRSRVLRDRGGRSRFCRRAARWSGRRRRAGRGR